MATFTYTSSEYNFATRDPQNYKKYQAYKEAKTQEYIDAEIKARRAKTGKEPSALSQQIIQKQAELLAKNDATQKFRTEMETAGALTVAPPSPSPSPTPPPLQDKVAQKEQQKKVASDNAVGNDPYSYTGEESAFVPTPPTFERAAPPSKKEQERINKNNSAPIADQGAEAGAPPSQYDADQAGNIDSSSSKPQAVSPGSTPQGVFPNPLNDYVTTAYGISLHFMTLKQYNDVCVRGVPYTSSNQNVIAASGGRNNKELSRNPLFVNDIYIDTMKMKVVTANNSRTRGTNAIDIELTIVEPIGMTFVQSLVALAKQNNIKSWDHLPFVLRIDFFGTLEDGSYADPMAKNLTKFMCVKFIDLKINLSARGSEYVIRAIPQSHTSYTQSLSTIPNNTEIYGKTVKDFFLGNPKYNQSLKQALDDNQKKLVKNGNQKQADEYNFVIDSAFADSDIFEKEFHNITNSNMQNRVTKDKKPILDAGLFPINAGSNIKEVINQILKSSKYYKDLLASSSGDSKTGMDIHLITSSVEYDENAWDDIRQQYRRIITYHIKKWTYFNTKDPQSPMSIPDESKVNKVYNYIYTGKNTEIINCKIDFNTHFFIALTSFEDKTIQDNIQQNQERERTPRDLRTQENAFMPLRIYPVVMQSNAQQMTDGKKRGVEVNDLFNSVYTSAGDMLSVDLEILGDPDLIKQDDVFFPPGSLGNSTSLPFDNGQIFANLNFRIPDDIDLSNGLYQFRDETNYFSGTYQILIVDNNFVNGKFTQILKLVRVFENPSLKGSASDASQDETERLSKRYPSVKTDQTKQPDSDSDRFVIQDVESGQTIYDSDAPKAKSTKKPANTSDTFTITDPESGQNIYSSSQDTPNDSTKNKDLRAVPLKNLPTKDATASDVVNKKPESKKFTWNEATFAKNDPANYKKYENFYNEKYKEYYKAEVQKYGSNPSATNLQAAQARARLYAKEDATNIYKPAIEAAGAGR